MFSLEVLDQVKLSMHLPYSLPPAAWLQTKYKIFRFFDLTSLILQDAEKFIF